MSDRWEEINRIYDAAVEVEEKKRASFLENACDGDEELRREVESLLAYDQQAQQFIDRPALQLTAERLASEPPSLVGRKLGPYQVQVLLGSGGMGDVYRARDTRLNRIVAIKVLPRHLLERSDLRQRFEREARALRAHGDRQFQPVDVVLVSSPADRARSLYLATPKRLRPTVLGRFRH